MEDNNYAIFNGPKGKELNRLLAKLQFEEGYLIHMLKQLDEVQADPDMVEFLSKVDRMLDLYAQVQAQTIGEIHR